MRLKLRRELPCRLWLRQVLPTNEPEKDLERWDAEQARKHRMLGRMSLRDPSNLFIFISKSQEESRTYKPL